jgi:hypothetical protein
MTSNSPPKSWRSGGCHCGAVRFEANLPDQVVALSCNCSMCTATGFIHVIVEGPDFRVTKGEDTLTEYTFNTGVAKHRFCSVCGVKSFYVPRSHPDGISVNLRCLDENAGVAGRIVDFDGANWEDNIDAIKGEKGQAS